MRSPPFSLWLLAAAAAGLVVPAACQTFTKCNPLQASCPADPALGKSISIDFTQGASDQFDVSGSPSYSSDGMHLVVAKSGDAPTVTSKWYMMFGRVDVVMQAAPGAGIVSSFVLQSDDLDEIDLEWLGGDDQQVQSNYFGKGQTTTYTRGAFHSNPGNHDGFHTYSVEWNADHVIWQIDGNTVRTLTPQTAEQNQYPQTPMQLKLGVWSGGDPSNPPGTIQWAGGPTNYAAGPFTMVVKSVKATDFSTGSQYTYGDNSGAWTSIRSQGGTVNSGGSADPAADNPSSPSAADAPPQVTQTSSGSPSPFGPDGAAGGGRGGRDSSASHSSVWPWVASPSGVDNPNPTQSTLPGLPSGWTINASGKVVPPSSASKTSPPIKSTSSPSPSPRAGSSGNGGSDTVVVTSYDDKGFPVTVTLPAGYSTADKSYDQQGFPITPGPTPKPTPTPDGEKGARAASASLPISSDDLSSSSSSSSSSSLVSSRSSFSSSPSSPSLSSTAISSPALPKTTGAASSVRLASSLGLVCGIIATVWIL